MILYTNYLNILQLYTNYNFLYIIISVIFINKKGFPCPCACPILRKLLSQSFYVNVRARARARARKTLRSYINCVIIVLNVNRHSDTVNVSKENITTYKEKERMRKFIAGLALILIGMPYLLLAVRTPRPPYMEFELAGGYRRDSLEWSIEGPHGTPDVLSELEWSDLQIAQVMGTFRTVTCDNIYIRVYGDYGRIYDGKCTDSDFAGNNRTHEFARSTAKSERGEVFDVSGGIGYYFSFVGGRVSLAPIGGFAFNEQHLRNSKLNVEIDTITGRTGPVDGLHSNFRAKWNGPWAGMDFTFRMTPCSGLFGYGEFHWVRYHGTGHWNLRQDFVNDFKQHADGYGQVYSLGIWFDFLEGWQASAICKITRYKTKHGEDKTFFADGEGETRLNPVHWHSFSAMGAITYRY